MSFVHSAAVSFSFSVHLSGARVGHAGCRRPTVSSAPCARSLSIDTVAGQGGVEGLIAGSAAPPSHGSTQLQQQPAHTVSPRVSQHQRHVSAHQHALHGENVAAAADHSSAPLPPATGGAAELGADEPRPDAAAPA